MHSTSFDPCPHTAPFVIHHHVPHRCCFDRAASVPVSALQGPQLKWSRQRSAAELTGRPHRARELTQTALSRPYERLDLGRTYPQRRPDRVDRLRGQPRDSQAAPSCSPGENREQRVHVRARSLSTHVLQDHELLTFAPCAGTLLDPSDRMLRKLGTIFAGRLVSRVAPVRLLALSDGADEALFPCLDLLINLARASSPPPERHGERIHAPYASAQAPMRAVPPPFATGPPLRCTASSDGCASGGVIFASDFFTIETVWTAPCTGGPPSPLYRTPMRRGVQPGLPQSGQEAFSPPAPMPISHAVDKECLPASGSRPPHTARPKHPPRPCAHLSQLSR